MLAGIGWLCTLMSRLVPSTQRKLNLTTCNGDTTFDFFDISAFLQDLAAGCP